MFACSQKEPLVRGALEAGEQLWKMQGRSDYTLHLEISGDKIESGEFVAEIKGKKLISVTRNGQTLKNPDGFYTIEGLFRFLHDEIDLGRSPARYFNAPADSRVHQFMLLDKELGYPKRYVRSVFGTKHNITLEIELR
jgi:hypothetical protein